MFGVSAFITGSSGLVVVDDLDQRAAGVGDEVAVAIELVAPAR